MLSIYCYKLNHFIFFKDTFILKSLDVDLPFIVADKKLFLKKVKTLLKTHRLLKNRFKNLFN